MVNLSEMDIIVPVIGKNVDLKKLGFYAKRTTNASNGSFATIYVCDMRDDKNLRELFGITDKLKDAWDRQGTNITVYMKFEGDSVCVCGIRKFSDGEGARPSGCSSLTCTQQELRIVRRILSYITAQ